MRFTPHLFTSCALFALLLVGTASTASAQGFAPPPKTLWTKVGVITSFADKVFVGLDERRFNPQLKLGDRAEFYSTSGRKINGYLDTYHLMGDAMYVPFKDFMVLTSVPLFKYNHYHNDTVPFTTRAFGVGDPLLSAGYQWTPNSWKRFGSSLFAQVKIPTSFQTPYQDSATLGDGQVDVALRSANSISLGPVAADISATYRHRRPNTNGDFEIRLGDEIDVFAGLGTSPASGMWASIGYTYLYAFPWEIDGDDGTPVDLIQPEAHSLFASYYLELSREASTVTAFDAWVKVPIAGQDTPVLWSLGVGYSYSTSFADGQ